MKRLLKIVAAAVGVLVALLVAAVIIVPLLVDPNDFRDEINAAVEKRTGRHLLIRGDLRLSVFPWLGLEVGALELSNASEFGPEPFARLASADIKVKLLPLLRREVQVDTVSLHGLELRLARTATGKTNWADLVGPPKQAETPEPDKPASALAALAIGGVRITDGAVEWSDAMTKQHLQVEELELTVGAIDLASSFPLQTRFHLRSSAPTVTAQVALKGEITADLEQQRYRLEQTELRLDAQGALIPGGRMEAVLSTTAEADLSGERLTLSDLVLSAMGVRVESKAEVRRLLTTPEGRVRLDLTLQDAQRLTAALRDFLPSAVEPQTVQGTRATLAARFSLLDETAQADELTLQAAGVKAKMSGRADKILGAASVRGGLTVEVEDAARLAQAVSPFLPPELKREVVADVRMGLNYALDVGAQRLELTDLVARTAAVEWTGRAVVANLFGTPVAAGEVATKPFVPREVAASLGLALPKMADAGALTHGSLSTRFDVSADHAALKSLRLHLDGSSLTGSLSVEAFARPVIAYDLALDSFNIDRYLPPPSEAPTAPAPTTPAPGAAAAPLPLDLLRALTVDGEIRVGKLQAMNVKSSDIRVGLHGGKGLFRFTPLQAKLYEGRYSGEVAFDARTDTPRFDMNESLEQVQIGPLLADFMGKEVVSGKATIKADLQASGIDPMAIRKTLTGNAALRFENGAVSGINLGQLLRDAYAAYKKQPAPAEETRKTDFTDLTATVVLKNGIASNDDLSAKSPLFRVQGRGRADLVKETIDYRVDAAIVKSLEGQGGGSLDELKGLTVPLHITGSFTDPRFKVELAALLEAKAREALNREKARAEEKLKERLKGQEDKLKQDLEKGLKNLFKR